MTSMWAMVLLGATLTLDNLRVAVGIGTAGASRTVAVRFAVAFGLFEGAMPLLGLLAGNTLTTGLEPWAELLGATALAAAGLFILIGAMRKDDPGDLLASPWMLVGVPLTLSFDNLAAGFGLGLLGLPVFATALTLGTVSAGVCYIGFRVGDRIHSLTPHRAQLASGTVLLALAAWSLTGVMS